MKSKSVRAFINAHCQELHRCIARALGDPPGFKRQINDEDRRGWILNDEGLYNWARSEGVRI